MRIAYCSGRRGKGVCPEGCLPGGCVYPGGLPGGCLSRGVSAWRSLPHTPAQCMLGYTPPAQCMLGYKPPAQCMLRYTHTPCPVHDEIHTPEPSACWGTHRPPCPVHAGIHTPPAWCMLGYTPPVQCMLGYTYPVHAGIPPWTEFLTHACENITFPQLLLRTVTSSFWM